MAEVSWKHGEMHPWHWNPKILPEKKPTYYTTELQSRVFVTVITHQIEEENKYKRSSKRKFQYIHIFAHWHLTIIQIILIHDSLIIALLRHVVLWPKNKQLL